MYNYLSTQKKLETIDHKTNLNKRLQKYLYWESILPNIALILFNLLLVSLSVCNRRKNAFTIKWQNLISKDLNTLMEKKFGGINSRT